jgi:hypothetical protein
MPAPTNKWLPTFTQCEKVVVPFAVCVGADIFSVWTIDHTNVSSVTAHICEERIGTSFNGRDDLLPRPVPTCSSEMRYSLVGIVSRLLVNACDLHVCHFIPYFNVCVTRRSNSTSRCFISLTCARSPPG